MTTSTLKEAMFCRYCDNCIDFVRVDMDTLEIEQACLTTAMEIKTDDI